MTTTRDALAATLAAKHDIDEAAAAESITIYADQLGASPGDLTDEDADHIDLALQAHLAYDTSQPLDALSEATEAKRLADGASDDADDAWRTAIRAALADGQRVVDVAEAAGVTRERVYQIRDDRR